MNRRDCLQSLAASALLAADPAFAAGEARIRIGLTAVILADQVAFLSRWSRYLGERIRARVEFVVRDAYQSILDLLLSDQLDAAWICGYPYVRYQSELNLLAVPLYRGEPLYQSYLIRTRSGESGIRGWADLGGRVLAYSDPLSNSGWLVAQAQLSQAGVAPSQLKRAFFAHGHRNVAEAVAAGLAQTGSIDGYVWETMRLQGMAAVNQTQVVWQSEPFGFPPLVTRRRPAHPQTETLRQTLLRMSEDPQGRDLLSALNLTGFTAGAPALFESIRVQALAVPGSGVVG
jgi:phosphonate transport system substrate-binding protein